MLAFINRYLASVRKERLLLQRDKAGLAMLFLMPAALVLIMTLLQDSTFRVLEEKKIPVLVVNYDQDTFGLNIVEGLKHSRFFEIIDSLNGVVLNELVLRGEVAAGNFQIGIVVREGASNSIRNNMRYNMMQQLPQESPSGLENDTLRSESPAKVDVYFDPVTKNSFKQAIISALRQFSSMVEAKVMFGVYAGFINEMLEIQLKEPEAPRLLVDIKEQYATHDDDVAIPNATQHNVPAWAVFAMFFIVVPLAGNLIKERESGVFLRLRTMPGAHLATILGKMTTYFVVVFLQALLMLFIGIYLLPQLGLHQLDQGNNYMALAVLTIFIALAATGYGILVGTLAGSQEQASIFGSISVVILAALGGVWIPTFMMGEVMQVVTLFSPLNWSLAGYYDIFLRNAEISQLWPYLLSLGGFAFLCILVSWFKRDR